MIQPNAVNASGLNKATKAELIQIVLYCQSMEHVSDVLMQAFNNSPDATNHLGWCFKRVNQKTGESEDFELMIRRTEGKTTTELLGGVTKKYRELQDKYQELKSECEELKLSKGGQKDE